MALTKVQTIGIETGISLTGVTSAVNLNVTGITTVGVVSATSLNVSGVITATNFVGSGSQLTGVASTDNIRTNTNATFLQSVNVTGIVTAAGVNASGVITATSFSGSGANLTGLAATANVTTSSLVVIGVSTVAAGSTAAPSISPTGDSNTGIFFPSADTIAFGEGGSEAARIDSSGRLLLGTSSSRNDFFNNTTTVAGGIQLELSASDNLNRFMSFVSNNSDTGGPSFLFGKSRGTSANSKTIVQNDDQLAQLNFHGADGSDMVEAARISSHVDGTPGANDMPGRLVFSTTADGAASPTERARIDSSGRFGIGTQSPLQALHVYNGSNTIAAYLESTANVYLALKNTSQTAFIGATGSNITFENNGSERARIDSSGRFGLGTTSPLYELDVNGQCRIQSVFYVPQAYNSTTALAANVFIASDGTLSRSTSSIKYKTNVETIENSYSDALLQCRPVWYKSTSERDNPDWGWWGFIAEEVEQIDPRLCYYGVDENGNKIVESVQYDRFVPHLLNLIKRQQQAIETLEAKVAALESA